MIYLPNPERAIVTFDKLRDYCLNPDHPRGRHKARVFASALGFSANDAQQLRNMLLTMAQTQEVQLGTQNEFGQHYLLDAEIVGLQEMVTLRSVWIVRFGEEIARLVTCYVL